jgi:general transcription factor 3C polypeptide 5 (transcription factor C subunit 1)
MREFKFDLSRGWRPNEEILPPPHLTTHSIPFNWSFLQNPGITEEFDPVRGKIVLKNNQKLWKPKMLHLPYFMEAVPQGPTCGMPDDPQLRELVDELAVVFNERPIWSRRAITNHFSRSPLVHLIKEALPFIGYRFKGGPFRDGIVKYGLDPRKDKKYRQYQTISFQLFEKELRAIGTPWRDVRLVTKRNTTADATGHIFDGKSLTIDGKIWQLCDVTDPLLANLIQDAPVRPNFDIENDGWFYNGTIAKIRAIMKVKLVAVRTGKELMDSDFIPTLAMADQVPDRLSKHISVPVPNMQLSAATIQKLRQSGKEIEMVSSRYQAPKKAYRYSGPLRNRNPLDENRELAKKPKAAMKRLPRAKPSINPNSESKSPVDGEAGAVSQEQSVPNPLDPRLWAEQEEDGAPDSGMGDDGGIHDEVGAFGGYVDQLEGYDDDEMEDSDREEDDTDRSSDSSNSDSEMDENEDDEDHEGDDSDIADSIDFVQHYDPPQLAQDEEAR